MSTSTARNRRIAFSQNFLHSPRLVDRLLDRSGIGGDDLVVEVGPGRGAITERLARHCRQVLAVEKDPALVEGLRSRFAGSANVALFAADFLDFPLQLTPYKVFANNPFNITAAIVGKLTSGTSPPVDAYLCVQRQAAERFLGLPRETLVAVLLKPWFEPAIVHRFRPTDFAPAPRVEVVLLRLRLREAPLVTPDETALFGDLVAHAFSAWQPTVRDALAQILPERTVAEIERSTRVDLRRPPSALPVSAWLALAEAFRSAAGDQTAAIEGARSRVERRQDGLRKVHRTRAPLPTGRRPRNDRLRGRPDHGR